MNEAVPDFEAMTDDELSAWAESDAPSKTPGRVVRGREADELVRSMMGGRPNLGESTATVCGRSARRQVRLDATTNTWLDTYTQTHGLTPSEVIRQALVEFSARTAA